MRFNDSELIKELTKEWTGERFEDGRPKVSDQLLKRLSHVTTEAAYIAMVEKGYKLQFEGELKQTEPHKRLVGRAVTAVMVPTRPDVHNILLGYGRKEEGRTGFFNQWVIETMVENDVLVVDMCDQIMYGTYVGGNLSTAIKTRTKNGGAVIWGGLRDLEQIVDIPDFPVYYRGVHPSPIGDVMMTGMNVPTRIGRAVCLPGDVVLGTISGVVFIPAHLAEYVAIRAEKTYLRDSFSFERLESGTYTSAQVDQAWWPEFMMTDFMDWFHHSAKAENYQYLDWSEEMEDSKKPPRQKQFDGIVCYSYH